ncbi:MAG: hypothetical protein ACPGUE_00260 [Marinomonas sp.]
MFNVFIALVFVPFIAAFCWIIFTLFTKRGSKYTFYGEILKSYEGAKSNRRNQIHSISVHAVKADDERKVGLKVSGSRFGEHEMLPLVFTVEDAKKLISDMEKAIEFKEESKGTEQ